MVGSHWVEKMWSQMDTSIHREAGARGADFGDITMKVDVELFVCTRVYRGKERMVMDKLLGKTNRERRMGRGY